jgi:Ca2+-binding RTX toxin-like protein
VTRTPIPFIFQMTVRQCFLLSIALILAGVQAGSAAGATVSTQPRAGGTLVELLFVAAAGETNTVTLAASGGTVDVVDLGAALTPGTGCAAVTPNQVRCTGIHVATLTLGDGDDNFSVTPVGYSAPNGFVLVMGGAGNDLLSGSPNGDALLGESGNDTLSGGGGPEHLAGGDGDDSVDGGDGIDTIAFGAAVTMNLALGGAAGEGTDVIAGVEDVLGSPFADVIVGSSGRNRLDGRAGGDVIRARGGNDLIFGGAGADRLLGEAGADRISGGQGGDRIVGGPGRDRLRGEGGADRLFARDRRADVVNGGPGRDRARVDLRLDRVRAVEIRI